MSAAGPAAEIEAALVAYVTEQCRAERVEVRWLGLDPARLTPGGRAGWRGDPCRANPTLGLTWAVGADPDHLTVRPDLDVWVSAPIAARPVARGEPVEVTDGVVPMASLSGGAWTGEPGATLIAATALRAGEPLTRLNVRVAADAPSGSQVKLRVRVGDLVVTADGRLLSDGTVGHEVRAYVDATRAVVQGVLVSSDAVDVVGP